MRLAPITARAMPQRSVRVGCSRSQATARPQAKTGLRDTSTTELATVVKRSEAIQDQKCSARSIPDNVLKESRVQGAGGSAVILLLLPAPRFLLPCSTGRPP